MKSVLFISDVHLPYEDKSAVNLIAQAAREIKPTEIVFGGDIDDMYEISRFTKRKPITEDEIYRNLLYAKSWLTKWREHHPRAKMIKIDGNHEDRFARYVAEKAPMLRQMIRHPREILGLERLKIRHYPQGSIVRIGRLIYAHGDQWPTGYGSVNPAKQIFERTRESILFGHFHRYSSFRHRSVSGKEVGAWGNGCLCGPQEYLPYDNWNRGATLVMYSSHGYFRVQPLEIVNQKLIYPIKWRGTA